MDSKKYYEIRANFQNNYFKNVKPNLANFEEKRKQFIKQSKITSFVVYFIAIIIIYLIYAFFPQSDCWIVYLPIGLSTFALAFGIGFAIKNCNEYKLEQEIKRKIMPDLCKCFENLTWCKDSIDNPAEFFESNLVDYYNSSIFDDIFKGKYNSIDFKIIESELSHISGSGENKNRARVFRGTIIKLSMNESFKSQTIIRPKAIFKTPIQNLKTTELEDIVFSKKYDVYTDDEIESRVILTTSLMNKLNEIENKFNIKKINVAFYKNNLYIALQSKRDMFKICSFLSAEEYSLV